MAQSVRAIDSDFEAAARALSRVKGRLVTTGMGKAGLLAERIAAVFASVGVPSFFLHPAEAPHGDFGRLGRGDLLLAVSNSGATEELLRLLPALAAAHVPVIALVGDTGSPLARAARWVLSPGALAEVDRLGMVPTASAIAMQAVADALAVVVAELRRLDLEGYARLHPGGALGRRVMKVGQLMRTGERNPLVGVDQPLSEVIRVMTQTAGRPGCAVVVGRGGRLAGLFTDGDLRRLLERGEVALDRSVKPHLNTRPTTVAPELRVVEAAELLRARGIDQLPVVDELKRPVGLLDVQDLLAARFL